MANMGENMVSDSVVYILGKIWQIWGKIWHLILYILGTSVCSISLGVLVSVYHLWCLFSTVALLASGAQSQPSPVISPIPLSAVTRYQDQVIIDIMTDLSTALTHKLKALIYFDLARVSQPCRDIYQNLILFNNR